METDIHEKFWNDKSYTMRYTKSLQEQIKAGYGELSKLWEKCEKGSFDKYEKGEIERILWWLKKEIGLYKKQRNLGIEGDLLVGIEKIEKDVSDKEKLIMKINFNDQLHGDFAPIPVSDRDGDGTELQDRIKK